MGEGATTSLASGAVWGRYVLVEKLGRGAMGEVWVAIDPDLDRKVALKLLRGDRVVRPEDRKRLEAEARSMARLTHPNVVSIHDVGTVGDQIWIAMEFVDGETLDRWIGRGPHAWEQVLEVMRQAGAGLAAAHGVGLVHRDFKPANVMIGREGRVRVLDFGLARPEGSVAGLDGETTARSVTLDSDDGDTRSRSLVAAGKRIQGSPAYMSPEQHRGAPVDARSDLFSFCVSLFEALYGVRPFRGNNRLAVALAIVEGRIVELPADVRARVPDWIHSVVLRGLAGDPGERFTDMDELLAALERSPQQRRRRRIAIAGTIAGLAAVVALALASLPERDADACAAAGDAIADDWNVAVEATLRERIEARPEAKPLTGQRVVEGLERHVQAWSQASVQLCRDRRARRLTERLQASREACLAAQREALRRLASRSAEDLALVAGLAARPFAGLRALGDPSRCAELTPSGEGSALDVEQQAARLELELELALLDEPSPATAVVTASESTNADDPELALLRARVAAARGERDEAETQLHAAAAAATAGHPRVAAQAWLALTELELERLEGAPPAEPRERSAAVERTARLLDYADALTPDHDLVTRARLGLLAGRVARLDERAVDARLPMLDAAIGRFAAEHPREPDLLIALLELRGELAERAGRDADAAGDRERAEQLALATFGAR